MTRCGLPVVLSRLHYGVPEAFASTSCGLPVVLSRLHLEYVLEDMSPGCGLPVVLSRLHWQRCKALITTIFWWVAVRRTEAVRALFLDFSGVFQRKPPF